MSSEQYWDSAREIALADIAQLEDKDASYGSSWKKRGGVGAYMMLARKMDRLEKQVEAFNWDIFEAILQNPDEDGILDDIGDLRRYLFLVETEMRSRRVAIDIETIEPARGHSLSPMMNETPPVAPSPPSDPIPREAALERAHAGRAHDGQPVPDATYDFEKPIELDPVVEFPLKEPVSLADTQPDILKTTPYDGQASLVPDPLDVQADLTDKQPQLFRPSDFGGEDQQPETD